MVAQTARVRIDATWLGLHRPFRRLERAPSNPFQFVRVAQLTEPMAAAFYADGQLEYLFSRFGEILFLEPVWPRGWLQVSSVTEQYEQTGYRTQLDHFEDERLELCPIAFEDWVARSIERVWSLANEPRGL